MSAAVRTIHNSHYERSVLKNGKPGHRWVLRWDPRWDPAWYVCDIERCDRCGRWGSVTWVKRWWQRPLRAYDRSSIALDEPTLCLGCLNVMRALWNQQRVLWGNETLIRKIKTEARRAAA